MSKLKCWFVTIDDDDQGVAVIASSSSKAMSAVADWVPLEEDEIEHCSVSENKGIKILSTDKEGLIIETKEGLLRGIYGSSGETELTCELCGKDSIYCTAENGKIVCEECEIGNKPKLAS